MVTLNIGTHINRAYARLLQLLVAFLLAGFITNVHAAKGVSFDDPWENVNRTVFGFNDWLDTYALKPVAKGYNTITPKSIQQLVTNFFGNLGEIRNTANAIIQLKGGDALASLGRFGINSTIGMLGMLDVATPLGIEKRHQDFGLTLAHWNVPSGPFVVLPLLGPRTVRAGVGLLPDSMLSPKQMVEPESDRLYTQGLYIINVRAPY